jgi:hypothetical protein
MARPERNNVDYFPFICDEGKKMYYIEERYGNDGFAVFVKILRELAKSNYHYLDLSEQITLLFLSAKCKVSKELLIAIIEDLVLLEKFDANLWENYQIIWCQDFINSIQDAYKKRNNKCISYEGLLALLPSLRRSLPNKNTSHSPINPQRKEKEIKVKKNKEKNITPPPSTEVDTDSKNSSPNDKSILDEKQKQKARQLKRYERLSETLYDHVQESKNIKLPKTRIKAWAEDMVKLENINGIDYYRQKEALDWFINHYQEEYMPIIQSGAAFREKFTKIEDAKKRNTQSKRRKSGNTIGHLSPEPIDYGPVARWDEETQTIIPSGKFAQKPNN